MSDRRPIDDMIIRSLNRSLERMEKRAIEAEAVAEEYSLQVAAVLEEQGNEISRLLTEIERLQGQALAKAIEHKQGIERLVDEARGWRTRAFEAVLVNETLNLDLIDD